MEGKRKDSVAVVECNCMASVEESFDSIEVVLVGNSQVLEAVEEAETVLLEEEIVPVEEEVVEVDCRGIDSWGSSGN